MFPWALSLGKVQVGSDCSRKVATYLPTYLPGTYLTCTCLTWLPLGQFHQSESRKHSSSKHLQATTWMPRW